MILLILMLLSLIAIYFVRLLYIKKMKHATLAVMILYLYLILWIYSMFLIDVFNLGLGNKETAWTLVFRSDIYNSFVALTERMNSLPIGILQAIVVVATVILVAGFSIAFTGLFQISREIYIRACKKYNFKIGKEIRNTISQVTFVRTFSIIRMNCRANC